MEEVRALGLHKEIKILAGITPLKGVGGARYMQKFVPGMDVPQEIVDRMAAVREGRRRRRPRARRSPSR